MAKRPEVSPERPSAGSSSGNGGLRRSPPRPRRKPPLIFLSYCREDAYWVGLLLKVLKFLELKHRVRIFQDTRNIEIGDAWHEEVKQAIREASIAICFLSTDYFASKFCMTHEVPLIRKRHRQNRLRVYPVLLKDCLWDADKFWSSLQLFTDNGKHLVNGNGTSRSERVQQMFVVRHTMIYGNKTWEDVIYGRQLEEIVQQYPDKVRVVHALSREENLASAAPDVRRGRVSEALIREFIPDPTAVEVFTCGPGITKYDRLAAKERGEEPQPRFLETVLEALENIGVPDERIHRESYG